MTTPTADLSATVAALAAAEAALAAQFTAAADALREVGRASLPEAAARLKAEAVAAKQRLADYRAELVAELAGASAAMDDITAEIAEALAPRPVAAPAAPEDADEPAGSPYVRLAAGLVAAYDAGLIAAAPKPDAPKPDAPEMAAPEMAAPVAANAVASDRASAMVEILAAEPHLSNRELCRRVPSGRNGDAREARRRSA